MTQRQEVFKAAMEQAYQKFLRNFLCLYSAQRIEVCGCVVVCVCVGGCVCVCVCLMAFVMKSEVCNYGVQYIQCCKH